MKKCASCTKDLPDAALHCVFCGAKQPPAPAVQPGLAKTAFGYSANDVLDRMGRPIPPVASGPTLAAPPRPAAPPPAPSGFAPTAMHQAAPGQPPRPAPMAQPMPPPMAPTMAPGYAPSPPSPPSPPYPPQPSGPPGSYVPASSASAKTMFVQAPPGQGQPAPSPMFLQPSPPPSAMQTTFVPPAPQQPIAMAVPMRSPQSPMMAIPQAQPPPYFSSGQTSRVIRPIDPWHDSLRAMMFLWGVALLAAFATPLATSPDLVFNWKTILDGAGTARLPPLTIAAVGFLNVVVAFIPMPSAARGLIAGVLGLAGIAVPIALVGMPAWQPLTQMIGVVLLIPGLIIRNDYRDSILPRLMVTLGVLGVLLPFLVPQGSGTPQGSAIPLVNLFKGLIHLEGSLRVVPILQLGLITFAVISLLAWLPAPATGAAKLWAWVLILWSLITHVTALVVQGHLGAAISASPYNAIVPWIAGGAAGLGAAYLVLIGYGFAALLGKQLE